MKLIFLEPNMNFSLYVEAVKAALHWHRGFSPCPADSVKKPFVLMFNASSGWICSPSVICLKSRSNGLALVREGIYYPSCCLPKLPACVSTATLSPPPSYHPACRGSSRLCIGSLVLDMVWSLGLTRFTIYFAHLFTCRRNKQSSHISWFFSFNWTRASIGSAGKRQFSFDWITDYQQLILIRPNRMTQGFTKSKTCWVFGKTEFFMKLIKHIDIWIWSFSLRNNDDNI